MAPAELDLPIAKQLYMALREKGNPYWATLTAPERQWWIEQVGVARARVKSIVAQRQPVVGPASHPTEK